MKVIHLRGARRSTLVSVCAVTAVFVAAGSVVAADLSKAQLDFFEKQDECLA